MNKTAYRLRAKDIFSSQGAELLNLAWFVDRDGPACIYCGQTPQLPRKLIREHVIPRSMGGPNIAANIVVACPSCNHRKSYLLPMDMILRAFRHLIHCGENMRWVFEYVSQVQELRGTVPVAEIMAGLLQSSLPELVVEGHSSVSLQAEQQGH